MQDKTTSQKRVLQHRYVATSVDTETQALLCPRLGGNPFKSGSRCQHEAERLHKKVVRESVP